MNPEKMRAEYGKMIYLLQDLQSEEVGELLGFKLVKPMRTAHALLAEKNGLAMLDDALMHQATAEIAHLGKARFAVQREIKAKEKAREALARKYANATLTGEEILSVLYSISDNNAYLRFNRDPIDRMLTHLNACFDPKPPGPDREFSLGISVGAEGARLSHTHERQFLYVSQSLTLWREVSNDMFKLWTLAEQDLLHESNRYQLTNTGQGLNRVQHAPRVGKSDAPAASPVPTKTGRVGRVERRAPRRPQRPQRADVHRQVHAGAEDFRPGGSRRRCGRCSVRRPEHSRVRRVDVRIRRAVSQVHLGGFFPTRV